MDDKPIYGPAPVGPEYPFEPDYEQPYNVARVIGRFFADMVRVPAHWIRANIVEPNRGPKYYWYHRKYGRALPIDECYQDDQACIHEANLEYRRNYMVDRATLDLLRLRRDNCSYWYSTAYFRSSNGDEECKEMIDTYNREEINFFIKYGDQDYKFSVQKAYNKQKHRMIVERRKALKAQKEKENENKS